MAFTVKKIGPTACDWAVIGPRGFRFPGCSEVAARNLAERANWNVANGWDWNR